MMTPTVITTTQSVLNNYYIQFSLILYVSGSNITNSQLVSQLIYIFTTALNITSNQLSIIITTGVSQTVERVVAQVRFFSTATQSADDLLIETERQLNNSSSYIREQNLTSALNETSIQNIERYYICSNGITQQSTCTTIQTTIQTTTSGSSLSVLLIASIIPSVIGFISFIVWGFLFVKSFGRTPFKARTRKFERF
jgi:hypothetical protein